MHVREKSKDRMSLFNTDRKMMWFRRNIQKAAGVEPSNKKHLILVLMLLLSRLACDAHTVSQCCRQSSRSCRLYVLLCRSGNGTLGGALNRDAAAGILTLGKRNDEEHRLQSRLHQLLQGSRNKAAGILTMGKRMDELAGEAFEDWLGKSEATMRTQPSI